MNFFFFIGILPPLSKYDVEKEASKPKQYSRYGQDVKNNDEFHVEGVDDYYRCAILWDANCEKK